MGDVGREGDPDTLRSVSLLGISEPVGGMNQGVGGVFHMTFNVMTRQINNEIHIWVLELGGSPKVIIGSQSKRNYHVSLGGSHQGK